MAKFFRKIRKQLLKTNRIKKYLLYAIGEIALVVIGILIAVSINNYNEAKRLKKEELKILQSLESALKTNRLEFQGTMERQEDRLESINTILFGDLTNYPIEDLDDIIGRSSQSYTFNPSLGIFDALISSGKIELISNDSLKNNISGLRDVFIDFQEEEGEANFITKTYLQPFFFENYNIDPAILIDLQERTKEEAIRDRQFYMESLSKSEVKNMYFLLLQEVNHVVNGEGVALENLLVDLVNQAQGEIEKFKG